MKNNKQLMVALVISLCVHFFILFSSMVVVLPQFIDETILKRKRFEVKITTEKKFIPSMPDMHQGDGQPLRFESREFSGQLHTFLNNEKNISKKKNEKLLEDQPKTLAKVTQSERLFDVKRKPKSSRNLTPKRTRKVEKNKKGVITVAYDQIIDRIDQEIRIAELEDAFINKMPGFTPQTVSDDASISSYEFAGAGFGKAGTGSVLKRQNVLGDFTGALFWSLEVYEDPTDLKKYFRIRVSVNDEASEFKTIPKELTILVDCSKSIDDERLEEFRKGIAQGLKLLNEDDVFNLTIFKDRVFTFAKKPVSPTEINIETAVEFLNQFRVGEKTDAFDVLEKAIKKKPTKRPSYIMLLSDGRPTKGVTNSRELIAKISKANKGRKPIFAFSGGQWTNRYLLDFISYKNRGWAEYSYRTNRIAQNLEKLFERIDEPIIMNQRYFITGVNEDETFPHVLPDFFRKAEFTLYGTYDDNPELVVQLLGDVAGETKEFMMQGSFAEAAVGEKEIAVNWAYNKIYHLISQLKKSKRRNKKLLEEINVLLKKFDLKMPYLKDITQ